jgi:predicted lysophospholipase L1 biosynthesis ABC-type transport system permease subunit
LLLLLAAVLAVGGAMGALVWQRRDLVAFIKCDGYSRGVLWRWLCCETAILIVVGSSTGAVFGLYGGLLASHYTAAVTGFPVVYGTGLLNAIISFGAVSVVAVAVVALPGYLVARTPPRTVSPAY